MSANRDGDQDERGRINVLEAVSYTLVLGLIAAVATGWFNVMIPW